MTNNLEALSRKARACEVCLPHLAHGVRPVFQVSSNARILIAGQAPGSRVHASGIPFDDPSGERLRDWMGITRETFYNPEQVAILPMGFCYPGQGKSGDAPPREECAPLWRKAFLSAMPSIKVHLIIGQYAQVWHLPELAKETLTARVKRWHESPSDTIALPHPSPRNNRWLKNNPWFDAEVLPQLRKRIKKALAA